LCLAKDSFLYAWLKGRLPCFTKLKHVSLKLKDLCFSWNFQWILHGLGVTVDYSMHNCGLQHLSALTSLEVAMQA